MDFSTTRISTLDELIPRILFRKIRFEEIKEKWERGRENKNRVFLNNSGCVCQPALSAAPCLGFSQIRRNTSWIIFFQEWNTNTRFSDESAWFWSEWSKELTYNRCWQFQLTIFLFYWMRAQKEVWPRRAQERIYTLAKYSHVRGKFRKIECLFYFITYLETCKYFTIS